jgi:hypothetical protein
MTFWGFAWYWHYPASILYASNSHLQLLNDNDSHLHYKLVSAC